MEWTSRASVTTIMVTHHVKLALQQNPRIIILNDGIVKRDIPKDETLYLNEDEIIDLYRKI